MKDAKFLLLVITFVKMMELATWKMKKGNAIACQIIMENSVNISIVIRKFVKIYSFWQIHMNTLLN